jgi:multiple sugar transport system permease protein
MLGCVSSAPRPSRVNGDAMSALPVETRRAQRPARRRVAGYYLYIVPALSVTLAVMIYPLFYSLWLSTQRFTLKRPDEISFIGLKNYLDVLEDDVFRTSIVNTLVYMAGAVSIEFFLGFGLALLLNRKLRAEGLLRTSFLIPIVLTPVVAALMATYLLNPDFGIVNYLLGREIPWLGDPRLAMVSIIALDVWRNTPFVFLVLLAGLQAIPAERYEAAAIDGANYWQTLRHVVLRQLQPLIMIVLLIRIMDVFREFDTPFILTGGGPGNATEMVALYTYRIGFKYLDMGYAAALSFTMLAAVLIVCYFFVRQLQAAREV